MTTSDSTTPQDTATIQGAQADLANASRPGELVAAQAETAPTSTLPVIAGGDGNGDVLPAAGEIVTCPECGTAAVVTVSRRDAADFCRNCDYPLFWTPSEVVRGPGLDAGDASLRRLPGTVGQVSVASLICRVCSEPNAVNAKICVRCGSSLAPPPLPAPPPAPVVAAPPPPAPEPIPEEPKRGIPWWVWVIIGLALTAALVVIAILASR